MQGFHGGHQVSRESVQMRCGFAACFPTFQHWPKRAATAGTEFRSHPVDSRLVTALADALRSVGDILVGNSGAGHDMPHFFHIT